MTAYHFLRARTKCLTLFIPPDERISSPFHQYSRVLAPLYFFTSRGMDPSNSHSIAQYVLSSMAHLQGWGMAHVFTETSGWGLSKLERYLLSRRSCARFLECYRNQFPTTEVNHSFYHLPRPSTYEEWGAQVPEASSSRSRQVASSPMQNV